MTDAVGQAATEFAISADGTRIGFERRGIGPGIVLVHGGMQAGQHLRPLATALSDSFEAIVYDRRGRGASPAPVPAEGRRFDREVEDLQAVLAATGATRVFGLSAGALVSLRTALVTPAIERIALYEPPLSIDGSVSLAFTERYRRELTAGRLGAAMVTVFHGTDSGAMVWLPRAITVPLMSMAVRMEAPADELPLRELVPTVGEDFRMIEELAQTLPDYAALRRPVLLLGGSKSQAYLGTALSGLERTLPDVRRVTFRGVGHLGPVDDVPVVAAELRRFFA